MAASDLRSSPVLGTLHDRLLTLSSSPLPDIQELIANKPKPQTLRSGSAAVPVPAGATTAFTSASELLRAARAAGDDLLDIIDEPDSHAPKKFKATRVVKARATSKTPKTSKAPKRIAKTVITLSSDDETPQSPQITSKPGASCGGDIATRLDKSSQGVELQTKPLKKFTMPVSPSEAMNDEKEADSEKPRTKIKARKKVTKPETVSRHFSRNPFQGSDMPADGASAKCATASISESMNLEPAMQRRLDWTPPRPDTRFAQSGLFNESVGVLGEEAENTKEDASHLFKQLRDRYGHMEFNSVATASENLRSAQAIGKRKAIELISVHPHHTMNKADRSPSPAKEKASKKKPRTITEVAMAAYQIKSVEPALESRREQSLLDHFNVGNSEDGTNNASNSKGKGKAAKATKRNKKAASKQPELLSPRAAIRQSAAQEFVFGTSSQLAREQSPTFLKDLHAALRVSNMASDDDPFAGSPTASGACEPNKAGKGLWSESARGEGGELVDIEVIDLIDSPALPQNDAILDPWKDLPPPGPATSDFNETDVSLLEIGSRLISENATSQPLSSKPRSTITQNTITINSAATALPQSPLSSSSLVADLLADDMPPPSNQQQCQEEVEEALSPSTAVDRAAQSRPKYELFTDTKLSKEIARYGFKAVKSRTAMITLLDQCWRSKNQTLGSGALFSTTSAAAVRNARKTVSDAGLSSATTPTTKRPVGRPKKSTVIEATDDTASNTAPPAKRARGRTKKAVGVDSSSVEVRVQSQSQARTELNQDDNPVTPIKKRGRPRKDAVLTTSLQAMAAAPKPREKPTDRLPVEIKDSDLDSDEDGDSIFPEELFSPGPAEVSISDDTEVSLNLSPSDLRSTLFGHITKAVTSAPRTTDPSNPSWYEKMLMYDPIILEDFSAWLNSGQLTKVGYDGEVAPTEVKKWCESRSICCLWRINVHGKERKRF